MMKKWIGCVLAAMLVLCAIGAGAENYSFPMDGLRLKAEPEWRVLTATTLDAHADWLASLGADPQLLHADYAANHTVFEVFLPNGAQVALQAVQTEQSAAWGSVPYMSEAQRADFFASFDHAPYEAVAWAEGLPGVLEYTWALQAGGIPVRFCALTTVQYGYLYTLVGAGTASADALRAACGEVYAALEFLGAPQQETAVAETVAVPAPIEDDGQVTPMALVDFAGITYDDATNIIIKTIPDAEVMLQTSTDTLRNRADADGLVSFQMSTRRETTYTYTVSAQLEGRARSTMQVSVQRRLGADALDAAFRRTAKQLETYGYATLRDKPETIAGEPITFRGQVAGFMDADGFPCVMVYTSNPGRGVWTNPIWVVLTQATQVSEGDICTVYGDIRGDTIVQAGEDGEISVPVVVGRSIVR